MPRPRTNIQPRIVEAARARFLADGVDGASLREIARDAGTNIGMIAYYFKTKDELFLAVIEEVYAAMLADMTRLLRAEGTARQRLRNAFARLGNASDLELDVIRLIIREGMSSSTRLRRIIARFMRGHIPLILQTIADGLAAGELDDRLPPVMILLAAIGLGALPQFARRSTRAMELFAKLPDANGVADLSVDLLFKAVGAPKRKRR